MALYPLMSMDPGIDQPEFKKRMLETAGIQDVLSLVMDQMPGGMDAMGAMAGAGGPGGQAASQNGQNTQSAMRGRNTVGAGGQRRPANAAF
jgi:hypothetical protein